MLNEQSDMVDDGSEAFRRGIYDVRTQKRRAMMAMTSIARYAMTIQQHRNAQSDAMNFVKSGQPNFLYWLRATFGDALTALWLSRAPMLVLGGWLAAEKTNLQRYPREVFEAMHGQQHAPNAEVDHYIERVWGLLLTTKASAAEIAAAWQARGSNSALTNAQFLQSCCKSGHLYKEAANASSLVADRLAAQSSTWEGIAGVLLTQPLRARCSPEKNASNKSTETRRTIANEVAAAAHNPTTVITASPAVRPSQVNQGVGVIDCAKVLGSSVRDLPPIRSSFAVMEHIASLTQGQAFVEIGSRNGDLIECVSHVSQNATSIEIDPAYCTALEQRAASSGRWHVKCPMAFSGTLLTVPRAHVYFAWMQQFLDLPLLRAFQQLQRSGKIAPEAKFVLGFSDSSWPPEHRCWLRLQRYATSYSLVRFDERRPADSDKANFRRSGHSVIASFQPLLLDMDRMNRTAGGRWGCGQPPVEGVYLDSDIVSGKTPRDWFVGDTQKTGVIPVPSMG
jgi:hypothetical protein